MDDRIGDLWRADYGEAWRTIGINGPDLVMESVDAERDGGCKVTLIARTLVRQSGRRMTAREAAVYMEPDDTTSAAREEERDDV